MKTRALPMGVIFFLMSAGVALAIDNGVARTPPMGWNAFGTNTEFTADDMKAAIDALVSTGLRDCGYIYCCNDGHTGGESPYWPGKPGFVDFFKPIADYAHSKDLKYGVYMTTSTDPQATANDMKDAGIDFLKHDDWGTPTSDPIWRNVKEALDATGRQIVYSIHTGEGGGNPDYCHMWRTGADIEGNWNSVMGDFDANYWHLSVAGPGQWPDPDMMVTQWLDTKEERRAHMSMWCMIAAPLLACWEIIHNGTPSQLVLETIAIHCNTEIIAVDQDSLGKAAERIKVQGDLEVWAKDLRDGTKAVALFNRSGSGGTISIDKTALGWGAEQQIYVRDLWLHENQGSFAGTFSKDVATHAAEVYLMSPDPIGTPVKTLQKMERANAWLQENGYAGALPPSRILSVMQGNDLSAGLFDLLGRKTVAHMKVPCARALYILQPESGCKTALKTVWMQQK